MALYQLVKKGNEPFVDFLKGICILCVLFLHTMPKLEYFGVCFWADMAVPIFLLIQTFHVFKKEPESVGFPNFVKLFRRIIFPFILIQTIAIAIMCLGREDIDFVQIAKSFVVSGGFGPGSYYPWIYLQMAIALPIVVKILSKCNVLRSNALHKWGGVFLIVCILQEMAASLFHCPEAVWRLWFGRYIMLIWLGYDITVNGIGMNRWRWITSIVSFVALIVFAYVKPSVEPLFFDTGWAAHRWICYPYAAYLLLWIIYMLYKWTAQWTKGILIKFGKASYEIFLAQMILTTINYASIVSQSGVTAFLINFASSWVLSITVGLCWCYIRNLKNYDAEHTT